MSQAPQFIVFRGLEFEEPNTNEMLAKLHASVSTWKHMEHMGWWLPKFSTCEVGSRILPCARSSRTLCST